MLVKERMSRHPITIRPDMSLHDALRVMHDEKVRRLPVVNKEDKLVGIVLEKDLLYASPSPATSLSVYELNYLVSRITVESLMTRDVVTVSEDTSLEEAARIMADNNIGGLPVMRNDKLVGMITESDLFKVFWSYSVLASGARASHSKCPISVACWQRLRRRSPPGAPISSHWALFGATTRRIASW